MRYAALILLLAGCSTASDSRDWYEPLLAAHRAADAPAQAAGAETIRAKARWTLRDCIELSYLFNERLLSRGETYFQANLARDLVIAAALPNLAARATYFRQEFAPSFTSSSGVSLRARDEEYLRLKVPLFGGFREQHAAGAAGETITAEAALLLHEKSLIAALVGTAFTSILKIERTLATHEKILAIQRDRRQEMEDRVKAGVARRTELLLVESQLAGHEADAVRARNDLVVARERLAVLIGGRLDKPIEDDLPDRTFDSLDSLLKTAAENRLDLAALDSRRKAAERLVQAENSAWYPTLSFTGNLWAHRDGSLEDVDWDALFEAEINLFEGGATRARVAQAKSRLRQAELSHRGLLLDIGLEVREEYHAWLTFQETLKSFEKKVAFAEESHKLLQEEYKQRVATNLEVQLALNELSSAQLELDRARLDRKAAALRVLYATGQLR